VVDEDIDPSDTDDVIWALCTRTDPEKSIDIMKRGWMSFSHPLAHKPHIGDNTSRVLIDACRPFEAMDTFPKVNESSRELKEKVLQKWKGILF
jgi:4-hydroxy-3-polyprenylbenzoate decarboxylase